VRKTMAVLIGTWVLMAFSALARQIQPVSVPVVVGGRTVFYLRSGVASFSAEERAQAVSLRLDGFLHSLARDVRPVVRRSEFGFLILIRDEPIIAVTDADARAEGIGVEELAGRWASAMLECLLQGGADLDRETLPKRLLTAGAVVIFVIALGILILRVRRRASRWLEANRQRIPAIRFRDLEIVAAAKIQGVLSIAVRGAAATALLVTGAAALILIFEQFPVTRKYTQQGLLWIWDPVVAIGKGVLAYLPNLFYILIIVALTRFVLKGIDFVFAHAESGAISLEPWIHADVARPTSQIVKLVLIVLSIFFIAPLIPGTGSTAARGISVVLGLMVSFGSSSTVGNLIAGVVLTYMRPFKPGHRVRIGDISGDVMERTFLYTKILTIKNEQVIVPSLQALGSALMNYSVEAERKNLILHTEITIGYDAPWRAVHELLTRAADRTNGVLKDPQPFVLQTSLNDFFVTYQLNAYTDQPNRMACVYSELHQNIQDSFNEGGIEITSPHFTAIRDGNCTTIPERYRAARYRTPGFRLENVPSLGSE
jgi:small-conductance mechanosensitive channel